MCVRVFSPSVIFLSARTRDFFSWRGGMLGTSSRTFFSWPACTYVLTLAYQLCYSLPPPQFHGSLQKILCGLWNVDLHPKANLPAKFERNLRDRLAHMIWFSRTCSLNSFGPWQICIKCVCLVLEALCIFPSFLLNYMYVFRRKRFVLSLQLFGGNSRESVRNPAPH